MPKSTRALSPSLALFFTLSLAMLFAFPSCKEKPEEIVPTCQDGVLNGSETGVDCGGPDCPVCPTCEDGILNQGEEEIDCGGPCELGCYTAPPCNITVNTLNEAGNTIAVFDSFEVYTRSSGLHVVEAWGQNITVNFSTSLPKDRDGNYLVVEGYGPLTKYSFSIAVIFNPDNGYDLYYAQGGTLHLQVTSTAVSAVFCDVLIETDEPNLQPQYTVSGSFEFPN